MDPSFSEIGGSLDPGPAALWSSNSIARHRGHTDNTCCGAELLPFHRPLPALGSDQPCWHFRSREDWGLLRAGTTHENEMLGFSAVKFFDMVWSFCLFIWHWLLTVVLFPRSVLQQDRREGTYVAHTIRKAERTMLQSSPCIIPSTSSLKDSLWSANRPKSTQQAETGLLTSLNTPLGSRLSQIKSTEGVVQVFVPKTCVWQSPGGKKMQLPGFFAEPFTMPCYVLQRSRKY